MARIAALVALLAAACSQSVESTDPEGAAPDGGAGAPDQDASSAEADEETCEPPAGASSGKLVRPVYLVPADREADAQHLANIRHALGDAQLWLRARMPEGTSFRVHDTVEVVETGHDAAYYRAPAEGDGATHAFWFNALDDAFALTGADFDDPDSVWLFLLDAPADCGQATGGIDGVALLSGRHLAWLSGRPPSPACDDDAEITRCAAVGAVLLGLMDALGVPDPAACADDDDATPCPASMLTYGGHRGYPDAELAKDQLEFLSTHDFVKAVGLPDCQLACANPIAP